MNVSAESGMSDAAAVGGKAEGLVRLQESGISVPAWTVLGTDVFAAFLAANNLSSAVAELVAESHRDEALVRAEDVRTRIAAAPLPKKTRAQIDAACTELGDGPLAVRSSGVAEDGANHSHAGQFDTFLNVTGAEAVYDAVRQCWASAFSDRSIRYLYEHGATPSPGIAVVLQQFINARAAGVLFTIDPVRGSNESMLVSAVYGLGEGLVSGAVDADSVTVDRVTGAVIDRVIGDKDEQFTAGGTGIESTAVPVELREVCAISDVEIAQLVELGVQIEGISGGPQDIEWLIAGDQIWIVQARPVTATATGGVSGALIRGAGEDLGDDELRIWDNSNIIESFSGISSPLTFTTAADVYGRVYLSYARSLRVPRDQLAQIQHWNTVMLGYFHGRVYYNLLHWYRMVGIAPGYPLNRRVLEVALGVDEPLDNELAKTLSPFTFGSLPRKLVSRVVTTATYVKRFVQIDRLSDEFMEGFYRVYDEYDAVDYNVLPGEEVYARYRTMERDLVDRWGPMMVLDAILLTSSGLLYALTQAFVKDPPEWFLYAVVSPGSDVESAEPARAMSAMAEYVRTDAELLNFVNTTAVDEAYGLLQSSSWTTFAEMVDDYIDRYGYRSLDELKLETPDLREDPSSLFVMLRSALPDAPLGRRDEADEYLDAHLGGLRRMIYEKLRSKTSRSLANRERLRFCRTRAFGMVKRMLRALGRDLAARGLLDEFSDVFYLRLDELRGCYEGDTDTGTLKDLVAQRKAQRVRDSRLVAPSRFVTRGPLFSATELAQQGWVPITATDAAEPGTILPGTPSASGVVEGRAVVVDEPRDVAGGILVAYRTDPGWVAALPSASALVIERGSPLTHVAIIARELGVPTVVQVRDVTKLVRTGMRLIVDGTQGTVTVLAQDTEEESDHE